MTALNEQAPPRRTAGLAKSQTIGGGLHDDHTTPSAGDLLGEAKRFLFLLDEEANGFTFQTFDDSEHKDQCLAHIWHGTLADHVDALTDLGKRGAGIFVTVNATDGKGRKAGNIKRVRAVFADFDGAPLPEAWPLEPHIIVESSPRRWHVYWLVDGLPLDDFGRVQKAIAMRYDSDDSVCDLPRVMRLPGFLHRKGAPFLSHIIHESGGLPYTAETIREAFAPVSTPRPAVVTSATGGASSTESLVRELLAGNNLHDSTRNLAFRYVDDGMRPGKIVENLRALMQAMPDKGDTDRWQARYNDIPRLVTDAGTKLDTDAHARPEFELLTYDGLMKQPDMVWRVRDVLPEQGVGLVVGQSQAGKSFVAIDLLLRLASGMDWFGHELLRPCRTVYCVLEGRAGIKQRVRAWHEHHRCDVGDGFRVSRTPFEITNLDHIDRLVTAVGEVGGGDVICVDTLAQASPGLDENSGQDMGLIIQGLQALQQRTGGLVLGVHHMGKDTTRGARGHSSLYAAMDVVLGVSSNGSRKVSTDIAHGGKTKDGEPITHSFDLEHVDFGAGTGSAVVVASDMEAKKPRLTPSQRLAVSTYRDACTDGLGEFDKDGKFTGLHLEDWRREFYARSTACTTEAKQKSFSRVRRDMQALGVLTVRDDVYLMPELVPAAGILATKQSAGQTRT